VTAVITDVSPNILWRKEVELPKTGGMEMGMLIVKSLIQEVCHLTRSQNLPILGLGLSIPGMVDIETNRLLAAYELGWQNFDLNSLMEGNEDINFYVGNEAHMSGLGERYFGSSEKSACTLYIHWGAGISGAILINENVVPGIMGLAGEVGHFSLDPTGELCQCGNRGCWNTLVNFRSLLKQMKPTEAIEKISQQIGCGEDSLDNLCINSFVQLVRLGDKPTLAVLEKSAQWLGIGLASLINLFNPDLIILGGPLSQTFDFVYPMIQEEINQRALPWQGGSCSVQASRHGQDGCLIGAVATVIWNIFNNPEEPIRKTFRRKIKK
jgi:predicted NBD/HSP70 family sugar kinase